MTRLRAGEEHLVHYSESDHKLHKTVPVGHVIAPACAVVLPLPFSSF